MGNYHIHIAARTMILSSDLAGVRAAVGQKPQSADHLSEYDVGLGFRVESLGFRVLGFGLTIIIMTLKLLIIARLWVLPQLSNSL